MKLFLVLVMLVLIVGAAGAAYYFFMMKSVPTDNAIATTTPHVATVEGSNANITPGGIIPNISEPPPAPPGTPAPALTGTQTRFDLTTVRWTFKNLGTDKAGAPSTNVTVEYNNGRKDLGKIGGTCQKLAETSWKPLPGEVEGAICYFAGVGTEFAIFQEGEIFVLKKGVIDEGTPETGSTRGNFTVISQL